MCGVGYSVDVLVVVVVMWLLSLNLGTNLKWVTPKAYVAPAAWKNRRRK